MKHVRLAIVLLVASVAGAGGGSPSSQESARLPDMNDRLVDPFQAAPGLRATVMVFARTDCPISNRYADEVRRLFQQFAQDGIRFWLVYPASESVAAIRKHHQLFKYPMDALRDPQQRLAKHIGIAVTPEAALFDRDGRLLYAGRIDDRYMEHGVERPAPTRRDLEEALVATLAGNAVRARRAPAVGCLLSDVAQ